MNKYLIPYSNTILQAIEKINNFSTGSVLVLFVIDINKKIIGSVSDGDIRRALINGYKLEDKVMLVMNRNFNFIQKNDKRLIDKIINFRQENMRIIPILDNKKQIIDIFNFNENKSLLPLDAVIMAGGKGTRLHPYTKDVPKPMLELENKPIIAHNIDRLISFGIKNFYISVNHLKDQIIKFLDKNYKNKNINIKYIEENQPLGTLGSVGLVKEYKNDDILVLNADILTNLDFEDFYVTYKKNSDDMSIAAFNVKIDIPYAVLETSKNRIKSFIEKPSYTYHSNAGIYLFKKELVKQIPNNQKYDAIDFMSDLIERKKNVTHFPIRGYWLDIGNLQNYKKAKEDIEHIKFD